MRLLRRCVVVLCFVLCCAGVAVAAPTSRATLAGTWSGTYSGPYTGTFTLHWRLLNGTKLRGSITLSRPSGTFPITGSVRGSAITFGAVGAGATYTGTASASSMSGHYHTAQGDGTWSAHKKS